MITIFVDEAYAFDFLAILEVKYDFSHDKNIFNKIVECQQHIRDQIGFGKWEEVYASREYSDLVEANRRTFYWVDKAKTDSCKASDVDRSNYERCKARNVLQMKFFNTDVSEKKFGYEKYD